MLCVLRCISLASIVLLTSSGHGQPGKDFLASYKGTPFHDSRYQAGAQKIPGTLMCAYYDLGGEGVAYHDADAKNNGSGALNPANGTYRNEFRMHEGVDTSYTKFGLDPKIDDNPYNKAVSHKELLYVGWTEPGEWFNLTVDVAKSADYAIDILYTSNRSGTISLDINGTPATDPLKVSSTSDPADPIPWRQWHHWNIAHDLARIHLDKGRHVITLRTLTEGQMNFATLRFRPTSDPISRDSHVTDGVSRVMQITQISPLKWDHGVFPDKPERAASDPKLPRDGLR